MKFKTSLAARRRLARDYEAKLQRQKELLAEYAAACRYHNRPVPPELGEVLGVVENRIRQFRQVKQILLETTAGIGVEPIVKRFMEDHREDSAIIQRFLERGAA